ncbi:putative transcription factor B3-Domain family [Rosa chinensis]|uniref:Putative transcription factor B3-Domain family n=1 Tax=Rosa chinensis TaxID=74649 RepID=A0A2P6QAJ8_ROSCH|nr:putative transcription factor B3-Domain family [Rosa chinensis]
MLICPSGKCWNVELERTENGLFFHNDGWQTFVKDHLLQVGDFLVFRYDGESNFEVTLYDRTCCEKDVKVPKRRRGRPAANERNSAQVINLETENYNKKAEKKTSIDGRRSRNYVMPGKGIRCEGVNQTSNGSILFKSENSYLKLTLKRKAQQYVVAIEVAITEGLMHKKTVEIQDPTGRSWPTKLVTVTSKQQNRWSNDRLDMSTGWSECCKANKISAGDNCHF